jgi:hypothetical protein
MTTVFISWQSDNPKLKEDFRRCVKAAAKKAEMSWDEAMRDVPGAAYMPATIFSKIHACDVFAADVSMVCGKNPNPNVLIELGYAAAVKGWGRVLLYSDKKFGEPERLPFDIRQRTIIPGLDSSLWVNHLREAAALKADGIGHDQALVEIFATEIRANQLLHEFLVMQDMHGSFPRARWSELGNLISVWQGPERVFLNKELSDWLCRANQTLIVAARAIANLILDRGQEILTTKSDRLREEGYEFWEKEVQRANDAAKAAAVVLFEFFELAVSEGFTYPIA